jgi:hypothetical protein
MVRFLAVAAFFAATVAFGDVCTWLGGSGKWSDKEKWEGGAVPVFVVAGPLDR